MTEAVEPESWPVEVLNVAQLGLPVIENDNAPPRGLEAVGLNEYVCPCITDDGGLRYIVGGGGAATVTVIEYAVSDAVDWPSLTEIVIPFVTPTSVDAGVPDRRPVAVSNAAHVGLFAIENVSVPPSPPDAAGVNV